MFELAIVRPFYFEESDDTEKVLFPEYVLRTALQGHGGLRGGERTRNPEAGGGIVHGIPS